MAERPSGDGEGRTGRQAYRSIRTKALIARSPSRRTTRRP
jgi:hypothetical protein